MKEKKNNNWIFLTNKDYIVESKKIKKIYLKNINSSYLHRYIYEKTILKKVINIVKPDLILSLQNIGINTKYNQVLYIHQALPFQKNLINHVDSFMTFAKMKLMKRRLRTDINKAIRIIVQTNYMKDLIGNYNKNIIVSLPAFKFTDVQQHIESENFIYPTNSQKYKGLDNIINFARLLKKKNNHALIKLTLSGNENKSILKMAEIIKTENLNISFIGRQSKDKMKDLYKNNNLLFTSKVESLGLPLIEAAHYGCKIFAYDTKASREVLNNYENKVFFNDENISEKYEEFLNMNNKNIGKNIFGESIVNILQQQQLIN